MAGVAFQIPSILGSSSEDLTLETLLYASVDFCALPANVKPSKI